MFARRSFQSAVVLRAPEVHDPGRHQDASEARGRRPRQLQVSQTRCDRSGGKEGVRAQTQTPRHEHTHSIRLLTSALFLSSSLRSGHSLSRPAKPFTHSAEHTPSHSENRSFFPSVPTFSPPAIFNQAIKFQC